MIPNEAVLLPLPWPVLTTRSGRSLFDLRLSLCSRGSRVLLRLAHATRLLSTSSTSDSARRSSRRRHRAPIASATSAAIPSRTYPSSVSTTNDAAPRAPQPRGRPARVGPRRRPPVREEDEQGTPLPVAQALPF